jgi:glycosyltransferase involved in cell wall biosynthesis
LLALVSRGAAPGTPDVSANASLHLYHQSDFGSQVHEQILKIAQIAPLAERVPPRFYGGTERVVSYLTEELVRRGHEVLLFASGDSVTSATLVPGARRALRLDPSACDALPPMVLLLEQARKRASEFDVLHFHIETLHFPLFRAMADRTLTTLHGRLDWPDLAAFYLEYGEMPVVSISDAQRRHLPHARWIATVPHGLPRNLFRFHPAPRGGYLAFLGRVSPEKRVDRAITIAKRAGIPLKIAAKVDRADVSYFEREIRPLLDHPLVEWIGEIGDAEKQGFLGDALALLFPIDWPEPFGLVMIEAMASGTPIIAYRRGSVPEVIEHGLSGWIVEDEEGALEAVRRLADMDRGAVRACFERRFTVERMAENYLRVYERLVEMRALHHVRAPVAPTDRLAPPWN